MKKTYLLLPLLLVLLSSNSMKAQPLYQAPVPQVQTGAYHDILLGPQLTSRLAPNAENLRLVDTSGIEIPYLFNAQEPSQLNVALKWYPQRGKAERWRRYSRSIFENPRRDAIDEMVLKVRNADVTQHFWLSGSDDMTNWRIIKEDYSYASAYDLSSTYNLITLQFPPVDYRYYKVEIRHYWREPIDVMGAGYYRVDAQEGRYTEIPDVQVTQTDDVGEKRSYIEIDLGGMQYVERLHLQIDGPERYYRNAVLEGGGMRREIALTSKEVPRFEFEGLRAEKMRLTIENLDDQPVKVVRVRAYQLRRSVTARLSKGMEAQLLVYQEDYRAPAYDLVHFAAELPARRPVLRMDSLEAVAVVPAVQKRSQPAAAVQHSSSGDGQPSSNPVETPAEDSDMRALLREPALLWGGIGLLAALMVWFSLRALKEKDV